LVAKNGLGEEKKRDGCEEKGEEESVWEDAE
jgi:hypothetical protein